MPDDAKTISALRSGKVAARITSGDSMRPLMRPGQRQILVPVLTDDVAALLRCTRYAGQALEGDLCYVPPAELKPGDAVFCRVGPSVFTHWVLAIRDPDWPEFLVGRADGKADGWTREVYGKCVRVEE